MAKALPTEIQSDLTLYNLNESIRKQRADLDTAISKIASGTYSGKTIISEALNRLEDSIKTLIELVEKVIIPEESFQDFLDANITLDEFASFDMLDYYNGLQKLLLYLNGFHVALLSLQDAPTKPIAPTQEIDGNILDVLNSNEFLEQGFRNPVFDNTPEYTYYTVVDGDTLQTIANKVFDGDTYRWPELAEANELSDNSLIDQDLVGLVIKVPVAQEVNASQIENNLVYEAFFSGTDQKSIDRFTYGSDLKIVNKHFEISGIGDLRRTEGIPLIVQNLQSRFNARKGSLNPLEQNWGVNKIEDNANVPSIIALDRLLSDMEAQAVEDGRVLYASALRRTTIKKGDRFDVKMEINLIGGKSFTETFSNIL
jgi:hypothetical protein